MNKIFAALIVATFASSAFAAAHMKDGNKPMSAASSASAAKKGEMKGDMKKGEMKKDEAKK